MEIIREFTQTLEERLSEPLNFIQVVLGPRQVGKTTGLRQLVERWDGPTHMVTADEVSPPRAEWIELNWRLAQEKGRNTVLIIDEIQKIPGWSNTVKRLFDATRSERALKVVLLGSASLPLQQGLADSLAGRYELVRADHWNLAECEVAFGWDLNMFIKFGGYPGAAELVNDVSRWCSFLRDSIIEPVLLKDLLSLTAISKPALFRQTFELALSYPAQEISLQKLLGQLQESGNVSTIKHYLDIFEGAYLLRALQKYSGSHVKKRGSSPKILPLNTALVNALQNPDRVDSDPEWYGRLFESAIGAALSREFPRLYYWRKGDREVDFVIEDGGRILAVEVKSGRIRHTAGLSEFCKAYPKAIPIIIDRERGTQLLRGIQLAEVIADC